MKLKNKILIRSIIVFVITVILGVISVWLIKLCCGRALVDMGTIGDSFGGLSAITIGAMTAAVTFAAFCAQIQANNQMKNESIQSVFRSIFFEMLRNHRCLVENMSLKLSKETNYHDKTGTPYEYENGEPIFYILRSYFEELCGTIKKISVEYYGEDKYSNETIIKNTYKLFWNGLNGFDADWDDFFWNAAYVLKNDRLCPESSEYGEQNYTFKMAVSGCREMCANRNVFLQAQKDLLHTYFYRVSQMFRYIASEKNLELEKKKMYNDMILTSPDEVALAYYHCMAGMFGIETEKILCKIKESSFFGDIEKEICSSEVSC